MKKLMISSVIAMVLSQATFASESIENSGESYLKTDKGVHFIVKFKDSNVHESLKSTPETDSKISLMKANKMSEYDIQSYKEEYNVVDSGNQIGAYEIQSLRSVVNTDVEHLRSASLGYDEIVVEGSDVTKMISKLIATGKFDVVEPVYLYQKAETEFNDPLYEQQFYFREYSSRFKSSSDFEGMQSAVVNNLGEKVRIAVLDSGYYPHEDMTFKVEDGYNFVNKQMETNKGRTQDAKDEYTNESGVTCNDGHGLAVSSIIAATQNNSLGMKGVLPDQSVDIVPVRVLGCQGGSTVDIMEALLWTSGEEVTGVPNINQKVHVANLSLGGKRLTGCSMYEQEIIKQVVANGVTVVVAAGNNNLNAKQFSPASCPNVISVGSLMKAGDKANFSNYGEKVDLAAEGDSVYVAGLHVEKRDQYANGSGTSFSAPMVAGVVGALKLRYPELTPKQHEEMLRATARKNPSNSDKSNCLRYGCGAGLLQAKVVVSGKDNVLTDTKYTAEYRYKDFKTANDKVWLNEVGKTVDACKMVQYKWGSMGGKVNNVSYKLYSSQNGSPMNYLEQVELPQTVRQLNDNEVIGVQSCVGDSCGDIVPMYTGSLQKPLACTL